MINNEGGTITYNGAIPQAGALSLNLSIEIPADLSEVIIDLKLQQLTGKMTGIQTVFIDLIGYDSDVILTMADTKQRIVAKANTQGYYPVLSTNLMKFLISGNIAGEFPIIFLNFPIAAGVWGFNLLKGDKGEAGNDALPVEGGGEVIPPEGGTGGGNFESTLINLDGNVVPSGYLNYLAISNLSKTTIGAENYVVENGNSIRVLTSGVYAITGQLWFTSIADKPRVTWNLKLFGMSYVLTNDSFDGKTAFNMTAIKSVLSSANNMQVALYSPDGALSDCVLILNVVKLADLPI